MALLTTEEVQNITLNAKSVHKYADQAFFPAELTHAGARIGDQPFLNFFVRYHHRDAPERYSWSRVRRVMLLEEAMAMAMGQGAVTAPTVEWRGKTFWVCLTVERVHHEGAPSASAASRDATSSAATAVEDLTGDAEELVTLPQLSNTVPTQAEVVAFCAASAVLRPNEVYRDGILGEAPPVLPTEVEEPVAAPAAAAAVEAGKELGEEVMLDGQGEDALAEQPVPAPAPAAPAVDLRHFVPTARQVELLRQYKKRHLTHHQWTEEEIELSKTLRQRYSTIGVAAAPVRTVAFLQQHREEERKQKRQQQQQQQLQALASSTPANGDEEIDVDATTAPSHQTAQTAESAGGYTMTQTQRSTLSAIPPSLPLVANSAAAADTPLSPFLPRSVLRAQQQLSTPGQAPAAAAAAASAFDQRSPVDEDAMAGQLLGGAAGAGAHRSQLSVSQTPPPSQTTPPPATAASLGALSQHLSQLRAAEDSFYRYISDKVRSANLNRLADITKRNSQTNARNRRRGIANERRLEHKGNLLESRGLWVTDDKERASKAEDYVKAQAGDSSSTKKNDEGATAASAAAGGGAAGDGADTSKSAEEIFVERFKAYYDEQRISFADCAVDELFPEEGSDAELERVLQAAAAVAAASAGSGTGKGFNGAAGALPSAAGGLRTGRREVRRLLPNRLHTESASPALVQAQLLHRSTVRMAKRPREE